MTNLSIMRAQDFDGNTILSRVVLSTCPNQYDMVIESFHENFLESLIDFHWELEEEEVEALWEDMGEVYELECESFNPFNEEHIALVKEEVEMRTCSLEEENYEEYFHFFRKGKAVNPKAFMDFVNSLLKSDLGIIKLLKGAVMVQEDGSVLEFILA